MQHGHEPRPRPGEGGCHPAPPCPCREAAPGFLGAERVSAPALRGGTVWGTLHWSWVDLGFGLQEETRTNPGSRAAATTGRILENRSTLLSPQMLDVCGGVGFGYFRKIFFFPWGGRKHLSSNMTPHPGSLSPRPWWRWGLEMSQASGRHRPGGEGAWLGVLLQLSQGPTPPPPHARGSLKGLHVPLRHPRPSSPRFSEAQLPSPSGTRLPRGPMTSFQKPGFSVSLTCSPRGKCHV